MSFSIKGKTILFAGERVGELRGEARQLRMAAEKSHLRAAVEAWLEEPQTGTADPPPAAAPAPAPKAARKPAPGEIPPCPESDAWLGDLTPAVLAWWFRYHPAEAEERYAGRREPALAETLADIQAGRIGFNHAS